MKPTHRANAGTGRLPGAGNLPAFDVFFPNISAIQSIVIQAGGGDDTITIGTDDLIRQRLRLYRDAGITTIRAGLAASDDLDTRLATLARLGDLIADVNHELAR